MDYPMFISVGDWLDSIKMSQYKSNFMAAGYNTLDSVARMSIEWVEQLKYNRFFKCHESMSSLHVTRSAVQSVKLFYSSQRKLCIDR